MAVRGGRRPPRTPGWPRGLACALALAGCTERGRIEQCGGPTMGTHYQVKWVVRPGVNVPADLVQREVDALLRRVNEAFSTWDDGSVISRFNRHVSTEPFEIPAEHRAAFVAVTRLALEVAAASDGAFDPTVQPLVELLGFGKSEREPPTDDERAAALARVGWQKIKVLADDRLQKESSDVEITYSAVAPGWAADQIAARLAALGAPDCMVDVGGEIVCRGGKPGGGPWTIGIERPAAPGDLPRVHTTLPLAGGLATSGDYRNFRIVGDHVLHHLLDPRTGDNVRHGWASVSVLADGAGLADALATACIVLGPERAAPMLARYRARNVRALFLSAPSEAGVVREVRLGW